MQADLPFTVQVVADFESLPVPTYDPDWRFRARIESAEPHSPSYYRSSLVSIAGGVRGE